ncbi:MAG: hypothetical protein MAG795_00338 [Candidatus Woesearchaeota archaeon]|nr:hypothetical protein [Candidatus Woesearchaeota archaeon]
MEKYHRITHQTSITALFTILVFITSPILTYILTRNLSLDQFGAYSLFAVTISFFSVVLDLGLSDYVVAKLSGVSRRKSYIRDNRFFTILFFFAIYLFIVLGFVFFSNISDWFLNIFGLIEYSREFVFVILIIVSNLLFRVFNSYFHAKQEVGFASFMGFVNLSSWVYVLIFVLFFTKLNLLLVFFIWLFGVIMSLLIMLVKTRKEIKIMFKQVPRLPFFTKAIKYSLPLIAFQVGTWLIRVGDRYVLKYFTDLSSVGIYNFGYSLVSFVLGLANVITFVIYPYYSGHWKQKGVYQNMTIKYVLMLALPACFGLFFMREQFITLIAGQSYLSSSTIMAILILFPIFGALNILFYQTLLIKNKTWQAGITYLGVGILNIILNAIFIPTYGMVGAAIVNVLSYILIFIITWKLCKKWLEIDYEYIGGGKIIIASLAVGLIAFMINPKTLLPKILTVLLAGLVYIVLIFILNILTREEIKVLKQFFIRFLRYLN